jgi:hypothetical protein
MWQGLTVGLIVLVATTYAIWALVPAGTRFRLATRFAAWSRGAGRPAWIGRLAAALERAARLRLGGCSDCGTANPPAMSPTSRAKRDHMMSSRRNAAPDDRR